MSGSVNKVVLVGNVGREPEVRQTQAGADIVHLSVATSESWKDRSTGERKEKTEWHRVVIFNDHLGGIVQKYVKKGTKVYLEGQLQTRKWTDKEGNERYSTEVVLANFKGELQILADGASQEREEAPAGGANGYANRRNPPARSRDLDDDIPF